MSGKPGLFTADGRPVARSLQTVEQIRHCGDCHHAKLMPQPDGSFDINMLTCLEAPPQIGYVPQYRRALHGPELVGIQKMSEYPPVGRTMRGCSRWKGRTADDIAIEKIDQANTEQAETPLANQKAN